MERKDKETEGEKKNVGKETKKEGKETETVIKKKGKSNEQREEKLNDFTQ
jgi:hypothetical protein